MRLRKAVEDLAHQVAVREAIARHRRLLLRERVQVIGEERQLLPVSRALLPLRTISRHLLPPRHQAQSGVVRIRLRLQK